MSQRGRRPMIGPTAKKIMLKNPNMRPEEILAKMKGMGLSTTKGALSFYRTGIRKENPDLPNWGNAYLKKYYPKGRVNLGTGNEAIMRALWKNPRARTEEIQKEVKKENKKNVSKDRIAACRTKMKKWHQDIDFSQKPKPINLTKAQEKMIPEFLRLINEVHFRVIVPKSSWPIQPLKEFQDYAKTNVVSLVKNYKKGKGKSKKNYVYERVKFLFKDFKKKMLGQSTGLNSLQTRRLIRIIREKAKGKTDKQIANQEKCRESEIKELWKAYQTMLRIQGRTGSREEQ